MFSIECKIVHVGAEKKSSRFICNKFTSNLKILALLLMTRKFTLVVKIDKKYVHDFLKYLQSHARVWRSGRVLGWEPRGKRFEPSVCYMFSSGIARQM
jgi:hypothetical protein